MGDERLYTMCHELGHGYGLPHTNYNDDARYYFEDARSQYPDMSAEYEKAMEELYYEISQGSVLSPPKQQEENEIEENTIDEDILPIDVRGKWRCLREHPRGADFSRRLNDGFILEVHVLFPSSSR